MEVNKVEGREVLILLFGLPCMVTIIVLSAMFCGHFITKQSDRPTNVTVSAATPKIDVNVPQAAPPRVEVMAASPRIDVNVPQAIPPTINVTTPPAVVTVLRGDDHKTDAAKPVPADVAKPAPAKIEAPKEPPKPEPNKSSSSSEAVVPSVVVHKGPMITDEELTLDTLYKYAEKYVESYCRKNGLDPVAEAKNWQTKYVKNMTQAIMDNADGDEQSYINRIVVEKRNCFDLEKASPEQVVEGCRLMLRYRDGNLAWLKTMKDAATAENLKKTLVFLAAGVR